MKNRYEIRGDITAIFLKRRDGTILETIIDTEDLGKLLDFNRTWYAKLDRRKNRFYACVGIKGISIYLHRFLTDCPDDLVVDHINHNTLDNRKSNLQKVTADYNNAKKMYYTKTKKIRQCKNIRSDNKSGVTGVHFDKAKNMWVAELKYQGKRYFHKRFKTFEEAVEAIETARKELAEEIKKGDSESHLPPYPIISERSGIKQ